MTLLVNVQQKRKEFDRKKNMKRSTGNVAAAAAAQTEPGTVSQQYYTQNSRDVELRMNLIKMYFIG